MFIIGLQMICSREKGSTRCLILHRIFLGHLHQHTRHLVIGLDLLSRLGDDAVHDRSRQVRLVEQFAEVEAANVIILETADLVEHCLRAAFFQQHGNAAVGGKAGGALQAQKEAREPCPGILVELLLRSIDLVLILQAVAGGRNPHVAQLCSVAFIHFKISAGRDALQLQGVGTEADVAFCVQIDLAVIARPRSNPFPVSIYMGVMLATAVASFDSR